jgi:hypothetical protein
LFDAHSVVGWAADTTALAAPVSVDVYIDDQIQATLTADVFRQDLKEAGYGDGRKGFNLALTPTRSSPGVLVRLLVAGSNQLLATRSLRR